MSNTTKVSTMSSHYVCMYLVSPVLSDYWLNVSEVTPKGHGALYTLYAHDVMYYLAYLLRY